MKLNAKIKTMTKPLLVGLGGYLLVTSFLVIFVFSIRPNMSGFEVKKMVQVDPEINVIGYKTVASQKILIDILLNKPGGFMANDISPPFVMADDMKKFEIGAIKALRKTSLYIRENFTLPVGTQSKEDPDIVLADNALRITTDSWLFPPADHFFFIKGEYEKAADAYGRYLDRLIDDDPDDGNFFVRANSLKRLVMSHNKTLGSYATRLSAAISRTKIDLSTANDKNAVESKNISTSVREKTPYNDIDDIFWETMGYVWVLSEQLNQIEYDFASILEDKNALPSIRQIRRDLEDAQTYVWSPIIWNGSILPGEDKYSMANNYSIVLSSYVKGASAAMSNLEQFLEDG
jgi:hypothetical protein